MKKFVWGMLALSSSMLVNNAQAFSANELTSGAEKVWISIHSEAINNMNKNIARQFTLSAPQTFSSAQGNISVVNIPRSQLERLSEYMHEEFAACGGYLLHDSAAEALEYTKRTAFVTPFSSAAYSIDRPESVNAFLTNLSKTRIDDDIKTLSQFHTRHHQTQLGLDAANFLMDKWSAIAKDRSDISVEFFNHSWKQPSIIVTITGTQQADEYVVVGGHFDSYDKAANQTGRAPGMDDNAAGIAILTETLRAIVSTGFKPEKTIQLMGFAAEEQGIQGSYDIARKYKADNKNIIGMAQFDQIGFKVPGHPDVIFMTDYASAAQNTFMTQLLDAYVPAAKYGFDKCNSACSDHVRFYNEGYATSKLFESLKSGSGRNTGTHSPNDTKYDLEHIMNFARLAMTYTVELAKGSIGGTPPPPADNELLNGQAKTGLTGQRDAQLDYVMDVPAGATNLMFTLSDSQTRGPGADGDADLYVKFGAAPSLTSYDCRPYLTGNDEVCNIEAAQAGRYYVKLVGYRAFANVKLLGSYTTDTPSTQKITLDVAEDVYVGSAGRLKDVTNVFVDGDDNGEETRGLLKFNIGTSDIPKGSRIVSVSLKLGINNSSNDTFNLYAASTAWSESQFDWSSANVTGEVLASLTPTQIATTDFALNAAGIALVQSWIDGSANNGVLLASVSGSDGVKFYSRTHASGQAAQIVIEYQ